MARPTKDVSNENEALHEFAVALRALRLKAGNPTLAEMSSKSGISVSALSQATNGRNAPSWRVVGAYVGLFGGSATQWRAKWEEMRRQMRERMIHDVDDDGYSIPMNPSQRRAASWPAVWERWTRTGLITPPRRAETELDLRMSMHSLKAFRSISLRQISVISLYSHSSFGSALQGNRSVTPRLLIAYLKGCGVHTFGEQQTWLELLAHAVPEQREKAENELRKQHRSFR